MKVRYVVNGKFLNHRMNGQVRVAIEIIRELDKIVKKNQIEIVAPPGNKTIENLKNICIRRIGFGNVHIWEQTFFLWYVLRNNAVGINFLNSHPLLKPDICYIHDVLFKVYPHLYKGKYGRMQMLYNRLMFYNATKRATKIVTVSNFSKKEIIEHYCVTEERISVIYNGWQHMKRIIEDDSILNKLGLEPGKYFLTTGSLTPQKNLQWIVNNASFNPEKKYVIAGGIEGVGFDNSHFPSNVFFIGRVSDEEMKGLMSHCRAFIHPAIYEGFALTPLEAASVGARIVISKSSCLEEVYSNFAFYIDPNDYCVSIDDLIDKAENSFSEDYNERLLEKYSWRKSATLLYKIIDKSMQENITM